MWKIMITVYHHCIWIDLNTFHIKNKWDFLPNSYSILPSPSLFPIVLLLESFTVTSVRISLSQLCYNIRCHATTGEEQYKSLVLDITEYFLVYSTLFCVFCPILVASFQLNHPLTTSKQRPGRNFSTALVQILKGFTHKKSMEIHGQIKELIISFSAVKSASENLSLYRFGAYLKLIRFFW